MRACNRHRHHYRILSGWLLPVVPTSGDLRLLCLSAVHISPLYSRSRWRLVEGGGIEPPLIPGFSGNHRRGVELPQHFNGDGPNIPFIPKLPVCTKYSGFTFRIAAHRRQSRCLILPSSSSYWISCNGYSQLPVCRFPSSSVHSTLVRLKQEP